MSTYAYNNGNRAPCSKIIGIQFSILSAEEILNGSVAEITSKDTYVNNAPVIGGLFDPRMGVIDRELICPTDGHSHMTCPGYFGHIKLARPVFYIQYIKEVLKILKCVCFKCSKLLISKHKYKHAMNLDASARWKYVYGAASSISRCGEDTDDGCGCLQPKKIKKEGLATIYASWASKQTAPVEGGDKRKQAAAEEDTVVMMLTAEIVLRIFKRISDDDINFMGFSSQWARPESMICQVMLVPPPSVRPSVKQDTQQRSEDDLSHILVNIIKTNKMLQSKINTASADVVDDWTTVLQYYIATQVDNNIKGVASVAQRSGRPLKSIKDRLNGKAGRMRSNLMAKRVDFSARSVITADPCISIRELGVPMKVALNITKPVVVNDMNRAFLTGLVRNGPDVHPGAKILETRGGESISLRTFDRKSAVLENGDIVHRHMMDGDMVIFNRQPTLHRMSMMAHIVRVMRRGDTFRLNVADTKPYNADFDGDEMNMHMPQDLEAEIELKVLAAIPHQIISPANNSSIIGIYQDSMLGSYQITRPNIKFGAREAMNLLMSVKTVDEQKLYAALGKEGGTVTSFELMSQIMPPMTIQYKTNQFNADSEDFATSNNVMEINNGTFVRGQMTKSVMGGRTKGLLQRVCNDFGNAASSDFIDNLQNIVTDYMKQSSFSVGISDLDSNKRALQNIAVVIKSKNKDVDDLIDQTQLGIFENTSGHSNQDAFESRVKNILDKSRAESGRVGLNSLKDTNRFVAMVRAGSKGSDLNITFMVACLGQQDIDGKRIPYGFESRTLPHYSKYDDTGVARGFVENSYINGLSPQELFFHAMGGRIGLIDTAVKTSVTGYIQRRLVKGLEDLMVNYDMTVRSNKGKIVQFVCGDDAFDTIKMESQSLPLVHMSVADIYARYAVPKLSSKDAGEDGATTMAQILTPEALARHKKQSAALKKSTGEYVAYMTRMKGEIIKNVFKYTDDSAIHCPVSFMHIIENIRGQCGITATATTDLTVTDAHVMVEHYFGILEKNYYCAPTELFKTMYYFFLSPKVLVLHKRFNKASLTLLLETIILTYKRAIISPGEMVGIVAGQSIGEVSTQMTLNTFHFAGVASKSNVTRGVPRLEEITKLTPSPKNPSLTVYLKHDEETDKDKALAAKYMLEHTCLKTVVNTVEICFDPSDHNTLIQEDVEMLKKYHDFQSMVAECREENEGETDCPAATPSDKSKWIIRISLNQEQMLDKNITMDDISFTLKTIYEDTFSAIYSDFNSNELIFRIRMNIAAAKARKGPHVHPLDQLDQIYGLKLFQESLLKNIVLKGVTKIDRATIRTIKNTLREGEGGFEKRDIWVLDTVGSNMLDVLALDYIDSNRTISNDIVEIYNVLGIEAARQTIMTELIEVIEFDNTYINYHHFSILVDRMTHNAKLVSIFRYGINNDNIGPIAKASYEETPEMFLNAARHGELDNMRGISANVMCGQEGLYGTSAFQVILDISEMQKMTADSEYEPQDAVENIERAFADEAGSSGIDSECAPSKIAIVNNVVNIIDTQLGKDDEYDVDF